MLMYPPRSSFLARNCAIEGESAPAASALCGYGDFGDEEKRRLVIWIERCPLALDVSEYQTRG